ncbi:MAG: glutaredoxin 3 [Pseudomonadales bacterium]|jgi:glutaredoxin 3|nr:glutaredoxin 3 [Pseudomonadales bacterium]MDG1444127.1 glutaredoxin 3 [Pseudomonadales bacterium]
MANTNQQPVVLYTTRFCPYCVRAKALLNSKDVAYQELAVDSDQGLRREMIQKSKRTSVPQIWIGDTHVGGCDELFQLERKGTLDNMLQNQGESS